MKINLRDLVVRVLNVARLDLGGVTVTSSADELNILDGVTATAAELNLIDGSVAGTAVASKAAVLGANKELDVLALPVSGLKIGAGAGTAVAATAAELNTLASVAAGTSAASKAAVLGANKNLDILALPVSGLKIGAAAGTAVDATAAELNKVAGVTAGTAAASKAAVLGATKNLDVLAIADGGLSLGAGAGTAITATAIELNKTDGVALAAYLVVSEEVTFTETAGAGVWTGSVSVPADATLLDIIVNGVALWNSQTSATMTVGDVAVADGYFTAIDLKATDLLAGESLSFALAGGKAGAYIANSQVSPRYSASSRTISGIITKVGSSGTAGRTRMVVIYALSLATPAAASKV